MILVKQQMNWRVNLTVNQSLVFEIKNNSMLLMIFFLGT